MKKLQFISAFAAILIGATSQGQISQNNNNSPPGGAPFVGWNGTVGPARDLDINNKFNRPIKLYTNDIQRMSIENGGTTFADGRIAIYNTLPAGFAAQDRLHLHQNIRGPLMRFTNNLTGVTGTDGFRIGIIDDATVMLQNFENTSMQFLTNDIHRLMINNGGNGNTDGFVGIGNDLTNFTPQSRLHLHQNGGNVRLQFTKDLTGDNGNNGLQIGIRGNNTPIDPLRGYINMRENSPIEILTNNEQRIHVNEQRTTVIGSGSNSFNVNTSGFVGIGPNSQHPFYHPNGVWTDIGPFTLLHLHGVVSANDFAQTWGYRNWMRTGISFTDQTDYAYVGNRSVDPANNLNEFTICWSNDGGSGPVPNPDIHGGPDDMVFRFTSAYGGPGSGTNDFTNTADIDGRHIARFTADGLFGLGPNFGHTVNNPSYVRPQSMFHMSSYDDNEAWMQITNQTETQQTVTDGFRIGITSNGTAHIKQQEFLPLIFYIGNISTARMVPGQSSFLTSLGNSNFGMMGIGDFTSPSLPIDAKLDIDGDLRIRVVEEKTDLTRILVIDENDQNRVFWRNVDDLGTDDQTLIFNNTTNELTIEDGNTVDLSSINTDQQTLSINGNQLTISNGNTVPLPTGGGTGITQANNGVSINPLNSNQVQLGQANTNGVSLNGGQLLNNREIPLNGHSLLFSGLGNGSFVDRIFIGSTALSGVSVPHAGKLNVTHIANSGQRSAINGAADGSNTANQSYGITGYSQNGINQNIGVRGDAKDGGTTLMGDGNTGVLGEASGTGYKNTGVSGISTSRTSTVNYGGGFNATAIGGPTTVIELRGVSANAHGQASVQNVYGVYSQATGGVYTWAGWFDGKLHVTGQISSTNGTVITSDAMFKQNVTELTNAGDVLSQLQPKTYNLDSVGYTHFGFDTKQHMGFVAQEVETVLPDLVSNSVMPAQYDSLGNETSAEVDYLALNYQEFIPLLVAGYQEQQQTIEHLQNEMKDLKECLQEANICYGEGSRAANTHPNTEMNNRSIQLVNSNSIILDQNLPNPFAENTTITYNIPDDVKEAKLMFYNMNGRIIKEMMIEERGESKLTVYGDNLESGVYTYSLIADGKLIATKKMVKQ